VNYGDSLALTITANTGHFIADVSVDSVSVGAVSGYTFHNITQNHTLSASFGVNTYTITAAAGANGSVSPSGSTLVSYGDSLEFSISPNAGYFIANVFVDSVSVGAVSSYTFHNVSASHTISALFAISTYKVTSVAGANGSISPSGSTVVNYGDSLRFTITPNTGYFVSDVRVDSVSVGSMSSYTFTNITQAHTIQALFSVQTFKITASAGPGGTISPLGSTIVNYGDSLRFTITPNAGYFIADVHVDTSSAGQVTSYTFYNVQANHNISATFGTSNTLPTAATLVAPLDGDTVYLDLVGPGLDFIWHRSADPDVADIISYSLHLKGSALDTTLAGLSDTTISWAIVNLLQPGQTYQWTVISTDGIGTVASPDTFSFYADQAVGVKDAENKLPKVYALHQNYPNPFNPTTNVQFDLPRAATVTLIVYNILGQEVTVLANRESMDAGYKNFMFDASTIPSGVYLYRIYAEETGGNRYVSVKKMTLVK
jgi:hypothetical protein